MHFMTIITVFTSAIAALSLKGRRKPRVELLKVSEAQAVCGPDTSVRCCNNEAGNANNNNKRGLLGLLSTNPKTSDNCVDLSLNVIGILDGTLGQKCSGNVDITGDARPSFDTLLSHIPGVTLSDIYGSLSDKQHNDILDQLIDFLTQLQAHPWDGIGGLTFDHRGDVQLGPVVDETFWQVPDIQALWPEGETVATLNIGGPYETYVEYIIAHVAKYIRLIQTHEKLAFMRDIIPRLEAFVAALPRHSKELNNIKLRLAHKDLHFANMMYDPSTGKITGILDWEFAGVVPSPSWNPRRSFLWNGIDTPESLAQKYKLMEVFEERCKDKGCTVLEDAQFTSTLQEHTQGAVDFLRAIVEVSPRGQRQDLVQSWKLKVQENISYFEA
ncbi:uncharacterized protein FTJAE_9329 [Fusarium tjaetaba]|uniref:Aminoglycoside phosphotransferase domain-containing protein n=1 Tax=Fusarium tjaetaba TaxID=1567544 RepID=A0A8H5VNF0_9HYPO|nr:uncharacterized protein FTJAE_9329 [Fusarium tjaetaba]KAF5627244.1 hypothetical protein FTJAE_9329 [Fusarium tjaetaba]